MDGGMNKDEVIRMAREAGIERDDDFAFDESDSGVIYYIHPGTLERFAALVAAAERNRLEEKFMKIEALMQIREKQPNKPCCLAEREACAIAGGAAAMAGLSHDAVAAAIRARGTHDQR